MFKATLDEPKLLKNSIGTINELVTEGTFQINDEKIKLIGMNPSRVCMVVFKMLSSAFAEYNLDKEFKMSLNLDKFVDVLKRARASDKLRLKVGEEIEQLKIRMLGDTERKFSLPLLDLTEEEEEVPDLDFTSKIEIEPGFIKSSMKDISLVSEAVKFVAEDENVRLIGESGTNKAEVELNKDSPSLVSLEVDEKTESKYAIDYLKKISKASKIADTLTLQFKTDHPMRLDYKVLDRLELNFILAPRVEAK